MKSYASPDKKNSFVNYLNRIKSMQTSVSTFFFNLIKIKINHAINILSFEKGLCNLNPFIITPENELHYFRVVSRKYSLAI